MDLSCSDEDLNFIKRPVMKFHPPSEDEEQDDSRPATPPMDESFKLSKSLGLIVSPHSPPCRRIRSMKLIESPVPFFKSKLDQSFTSTPTPGSPCVQNIQRRITRTLPKLQRSRLNHLNLTDTKDKLNNSSICNQSVTAAVVNPFSASLNLSDSSKLKKKSKRNSNKSFSFESDDSSLTESSGHSVFDHSQENLKRVRLSDLNVSRYQEEFIEMEVIGSGDHGCVFKCLNKINGTEYAVKRGLNPVNNEKVAFKEICAHAILHHPNIVTNFSSWSENDFVYMQNEYCNGGNLEELIKSGPLEEKQLRKVLEHVAKGLRYIHSRNLAHMDIKPANIMIQRNPRFLKPYEMDDYCDDDDPTEETIYKIGDLGHITKLDDVDFEEGDCRYLPKEILQDDYTHLTKADIFALGLTLYESAGGGPLPKNGDEWHEIREGKIKTFPQYSNEFHDLIRRMIHPDPELRPTASELLLQSSTSAIYKTVKDKHELKAAKQKIQVLEQQLQDLLKYVKVFKKSQPDNKRQLTPLNNNKGDRLVGKKSKRSQSTTMF